jgi:putative membrane protein
MLAHLRHFLFGIGIGVANVIPGVSGGTMALIFGIYEEVVEAASSGVGAGLKLLRGDFSGFRTEVGALPWAFLFPLVVGIVATPFLGAGLLSSLLETRPELMRGLFFGLIVGSLPIPWLRIGKRDWSTLLLVLIAATSAFWLSGLPVLTVTDPPALMIFGAAALAICAMVLPGVSGAYLLLVFGMYQATLNALEQLDLRFIVLFGAGAAVGLGAFSVLLNWLLKHRHDGTMAVLVGLMLGSLRALWPWVTTNSELRLPGEGEVLGPVVLLGVLGLAITGGLSWWELSKRDVS